MVDASNPRWLSRLQHDSFSGTIGLMAAPGRYAPDGLDGDLEALAVAGGRMLLTLVETHELRSLGITDIATVARRKSLDWRHLPIRDFGAPDLDFEERWRKTGPIARERLRRGDLVAIHCWAGLGRTGTVAARLLVEFGEHPSSAIDLVRGARPGAIQSRDQELHILGYRPELDTHR